MTVGGARRRGCSPAAVTPPTRAPSDGRPPVSAKDLCLFGFPRPSGDGRGTAERSDESSSGLGNGSHSRSLSRLLRSVSGNERPLHLIVVAALVQAGRQPIRQHPFSRDSAPSPAQRVTVAVDYTAGAGHGARVAVESANENRSEFIISLITPRSGQDSTAMDQIRTATRTNEEDRANGRELDWRV